MPFKDEFAVGKHRPVYLWAGPGTIRMNRLKFMGAPVDEGVHHEAHTPSGAQRMGGEAGFNWAYLTYDWGFPPEVEREDQDDFRRAVQAYQAENVRVFGYIQTSNCVYNGSYRAKDWYARDSRGRLIYYYTGRYMTCWLHPGWLAHLREMTREIIAAGADVFYDNPWHAGQPLHFLEMWMGSPGCHCPRCREAFHAETGFQIPLSLHPESDEASRRYLRWRADLVTRTIRELREYARSLKPDVLVSVNDFDAVMRPSYLVYGIDLAGLAQAQDVLMIEDYGLPRWQPEENLLVNNALTLRTALALAGDTPLTTDPYDKGIGFDGVYPARRFVQGIAEAAACGVPMVVKGTEFVENGSFTLLTAEQYAPQRQAIGAIHRWLEANADLYHSRQNLAEIGLLFPGVELWHRWSQLAPRYFGVGQALIASKLPWKVVNAPEHLAGLKTLLVFGDVPAALKPSDEVRVVDVLKLPGWELPKPAFLQRNRWLQPPVEWFVVELFRSYFHSKLARSLLDGLGLAHFFLQSPFFRLPGEAQRRELVSALKTENRLRVESEAPLLVETFGRGDQTQIHLLNYARDSQKVNLEFGQTARGKILTPAGETAFEGASLALALDVYAIILLEKLP